MPKTTSTSENAKISLAALHLAATRGWESVTLALVAKQAKIPPDRLKKHFKAVPDLIPLIAEEIDRMALASMGKATGVAHDVLFDLLMARFDILQKNRKAILSIAQAAHRDRSLSCALARATFDGSYRLIDAARLDKPPRPILAAGLSAIYSWAFYVWRKDESRDMGKTMAALDRTLRVAGKAAELLKPKF
ncbi:MAG: hypothetical protein WCD70_00390 [Alphaproteobacteria bacterium]